MFEKGYKQTDDHKKNLSKSHKGKKFSINHIKNMSEVRKGKHYSSKTEFKKGLLPWNKGKHPKYMQRENHPQWKGGKFKDEYGYIWIRKPKHPYCVKNGYIKRARLIMEQILKRYLKPKEEIVHHLNGIKDDDRPENLKLFANHKEHRIFHYLFPVR